MPSGSATCLTPGRPPHARSGASDHTPISANTSTIASSSVSIARNASSTAVIGLPTPVAAMFAATSGASVGAGSGRASTHIASATVTAPATSAASVRVSAFGRSARAAVSVSRSRATAPISRAPVRPPPMAASVSATSTPESCTHASVSSRP